MPEKKRVSQAVTRPARTAVQATPAFALVEFIDAFWFDLTERQFGAAVVLLTLVIGWLQTLTENRVGWGLLRDVPPRTDPVPGD